MKATVEGVGGTWLSLGPACFSSSSSKASDGSAVGTTKYPRRGVGVERLIFILRLFQSAGGEEEEEERRGENPGRGAASLAWRWHIVAPLPSAIRGKRDGR